MYEELIDEQAVMLNEGRPLPDCITLTAGDGARLLADIRYMRIPGSKSPWPVRVGAIIYDCAIDNRAPVIECA